MKRRLSLILVFILGLSLVACGGAKGQIPKTPDATDEVKFVEEHLELLKTTDLSESEIDKIREMHTTAARAELEENLADWEATPEVLTVLPAYPHTFQWRYQTTETLSDGTKRVVFDLKVPFGDGMDDLLEEDDELFGLKAKLEDDKFADRYREFINKTTYILPSVLLRAPFDVTQTEDGLKFNEDAFLQFISRMAEGETYVLGSGDDADFDYVDGPNFKTATDAEAWDKLWGNERRVDDAKKLSVKGEVKDAQKTFDRTIKGLKTFDRKTLVNLFSEEEADAILEAFEYQPEFKDIMMLFLQYIHFDYVTGFAYDDDDVRLVYEVRAPREEIMDDMARDLDAEASQLEDFAEMKKLIDDWFADHVDDYYETNTITFPAIRQDGEWHFDIENMPGF